MDKILNFIHGKQVVARKTWKKNLPIRNSEFLLAFHTNLIQLNRTFLKLPVLQFQTRHTSDSFGK